MPDEQASVLHVLPWPGGGGETYVNQLARMDGYRFDRAYIAPGPTYGPTVVAGGVRAQLSGRHFDLLHVHGEVCATLCLPCLALLPSVLTTHGLHLMRRLEGWRRAAAEANLRLIVRAASRTICVSDADFGEVESLVGATERLVLIRNGVARLPRPTSEERASARATLGIPATATVGLYLAALDPHKEPITVARAALEATGRGVPLVMIFAGDGPLRNNLDALADEAAALRVVGFQDDIRPVLAASDFFVLPSRREGLSFSLLEAMSAGLPPVVSDIPGNPEAVGDAGVVVQPGDVADFTAAFERLAMDEEERLRMGERARERVAERFNRRQMVERTRAVYEDVLGAVQ